MKANMGSIDKRIRAIAAIIIAALYFTGIVEGTIGIVLLVLVSVLLITSFVGVCPLYLPFGIRTNKSSTK